MRRLHRQIEEAGHPSWPMSFWRAHPEPFFNRAASSIHPHSNYRHDDLWRAHDDHRGDHSDVRMTVVTRVPAPAVFRENTSGHCEEGGNTGK